MIVLAHGTLGYWDEFIFISVAVVFIILMIVSWIRSSATKPDLPSEDHPKSPDKSDYFRLD